MGLGSGIRKKPIPDPGAKKHRIPDPDPQHWEELGKNRIGDNMYMTLTQGSSKRTQ